MKQDEICDNIVKMAKSRAEWLLRYSLLNSDNLTHDGFLCFLKKKDISFIDNKILKKIKHQWKIWKLV